MYKVRKFLNTDAEVVAQLIAKTMKTTNIKDYSIEYIENDLKSLQADDLIERARQFHCFVIENSDDSSIIGVGSIGPFWGSKTESSLFNIFVDPDYQGHGLGRKIIETLETDEYFLRASRIEIPASKTALHFYQKMGYGFKNGIDEVDSEELYRLEKFNSAAQRLTK
ncbi:GNAT family N-acetyltransferase [Leuconostoc suionicum]|uniref:GNAT family N-acetyltransferase n=1 Tax=Leuconostoc suionicum TaxID=1511761 RepID=UPI00233E63F3|nr:GNAT family N-acetyltransferase [Leuconostoc suionicum]MDC2805168.1 GNAT family N-acetyltransferase [Leuconostoc suionicum]MDC2822680.1 GNAT family N-acetyltransferase [Leuconostoc suionicum]